MIPLIIGAGVAGLGIIVKAFQGDMNSRERYYKEEIRELEAIIVEQNRQRSRLLEGEIEVERLTVITETISSVMDEYERKIDEVREDIDVHEKALEDISKKTVQLERELNFSPDNKEARAELSLLKQLSSDITKSICTLNNFKDSFSKQHSEMNHQKLKSYESQLELLGEKLEILGLD